MNREEVFKLPTGQGSEPPVLCADGLMAMLICWPSEDDNLCGVQVQGEEDIRWIHCDDLTASRGGALKQRGAPKFPKTPGRDDVVQFMLAASFAQRGPEFILADDEPKPRYSIAAARVKVFIDDKPFEATGFKVEKDEELLDARTLTSPWAPGVVARSTDYLVLEGPELIPQDGEHAIRIVYADGRTTRIQGQSVPYGKGYAFRVLSWYVDLP